MNEVRPKVVWLGLLLCFGKKLSTNKTEEPQDEQGQQNAQHALQAEDENGAG